MSESPPSTDTVNREIGAARLKREAIKNGSARSSETPAVGFGSETPSFSPATVFRFSVPPLRNRLSPPPPSRIIRRQVSFYFPPIISSSSISSFTRLYFLFVILVYFRYGFTIQSKNFQFCISIRFIYLFMMCCFISLHS